MGRAKADHNSPFSIPVHLGRRVIMALLNTGSSISMIRAHLVPDNRPTFRWTAVTGVNRYVCTWPVIELTLWYAKMPHVFEILKVDNLPFRILLRRDVLGFGSLDQTAIQEVAAADEEPLGEEPNPAPDEKPEQIQVGLPQGLA